MAARRWFPAIKVVLAIVFDFYWLLTGGQEHDGRDPHAEAGQLPTNISYAESNATVLLIYLFRDLTRHDHWTYKTTRTEKIFTPIITAY